MKKFDITAVLGLMQPAQFVQRNGEWALSVSGAVDLSSGDNKPATYYHPDMTVQSSQLGKSNFYISSNLVNSMVWAVYTSKVADITISQKTLDDIKVNLIRLYTDQLLLVLPNMSLFYPGSKGVYIQLQLENYDINTTRIQMRQGRMAAILDAHVNLYVDKDSKNYPQKTISECTDCE